MARRVISSFMRACLYVLAGALTDIFHAKKRKKKAWSPHYTSGTVLGSGVQQTSAGVLPDPTGLGIRWERKTLNRETSRTWEVAGSFWKAWTGAEEQVGTLGRASGRGGRGSRLTKQQVGSVQTQALRRGDREQGVPLPNFCPLIC